MGFGLTEERKDGLEQIARRFKRDADRAEFQAMGGRTDIG